VNHEVQRVFHLTGVVADRDAAVTRLETLFGAGVLHKAEGETFGLEMRRAILWIGDNLIELIQPVGPSPMTAFLERFGGGLNGLGVEVTDVAAAERHLSGLGIEVAVRFDEDMFATRTARTGGLALQWTSRSVPDDPRWTGHLPRQAASVAPAERLAFVVGLVPDPAEDASTLARAMGTSATLLDRQSDAIGPNAAVGLGDCSLALYPVGSGDSDRVAWGARHERPRLLAIGLQVADLDTAVTALQDNGVGVVAHHTAGVVLDPAQLPVTVMLCDRLLPGDPRSAIATPTT
jgi:Glyoxalase/Bleomycin resistance protein/Dioxygenase superfamily